MTGMMERVGLAGLAAISVLAFAACGGGSSSSGFTLKATQACLEKAGYQTAVVQNRYFGGTNLRVKINSAPQLLNPNQPTGTVQPNTFVFVVFAKNAGGALAVENTAIDLAMKSLSNSGLLITRAGARAGMQVTRNVFYYSDTGALTQAERSKISACLR